MQFKLTLAVPASSIVFSPDQSVVFFVGLLFCSVCVFELSEQECGVNAINLENLLLLLLRICQEPVEGKLSSALVSWQVCLWRSYRAISGN